MLIWETIWAGHRSHNFELFIILAINELYCIKIVEEKRFDGAMEAIMSLSYHMDVHMVLARARQLLYEFRQLGSDQIPPELRHIADIVCC